MRSSAEIEIGDETWLAQADLIEDGDRLLVTQLEVRDWDGFRFEARFLSDRETQVITEALIAAHYRGES